MARQTDRLTKIGLEGFAAIDEYFGRPKEFCREKRRPDLKWPPVRKVLIYPDPKNHYVYQGNQISATEVVDSNEAAQRYSGQVYNDYHKGEASSVA